MAKPKDKSKVIQLSVKPEKGPDTGLAKEPHSFDLEEAKQRVIAKESSRERNNAKSESFAIVSEKMAIFNAEVRERKKTGWCERAWQDETALEEAIDEYMDFAYRLKLRPYKEGLCLWLDISLATYYAILQTGDLRSEKLKKFEVSLGYYSAQTIASTEGNPSGDIYLDKSRLGYTDIPAERTLNINVGVQQQVSSAALAQIVENTPIDVDYTEVE